MATNLPVLSLNMVLASESDLWALRFPGAQGVYILERPRGGDRGRHFEGAAAAGTVRVRSDDLADRSAVIVASEPMDENAGCTGAPLSPCAVASPSNPAAVAVRPLPKRPRDVQRSRVYRAER